MLILFAAVVLISFAAFFSLIALELIPAPVRRHKLHRHKRHHRRHS